MAFGMLPSEVRTRAKFADLRMFAAYCRRYGPMTPVRMFDRGPAMLATILARVNGNKDVRESDFLPYGRPQDPHEEG